MLLQNPQLAYALLQAQVVMRIVDPTTAATMLHSSAGITLDKPQLQAQYAPQPVINPSIVSNPAPITLNQVPAQNHFSSDVDLRNVRGPVLDQDMRSLPLPPTPHVPPQQTHAQESTYPRDPRMRPSDPRMQPKQPLQQIPPGMPSMAQARTIQGIPSGASDQEKAALIMQVLQLSDEQIALLPPEQRASILTLKDQIAKSTQQR